MAPTKLTWLLVLLTTVAAERDKTRWSRQINSNSDTSDWIPLSGPNPDPAPPVKRQAIAEPRILSEPTFSGPFIRPSGFGPEAFPSRTYFNAPANRQQPLYLQSVPAVPSAPQNYLTDQGFGQGIRFGLQQPNFPLGQGFLGSPFGFEGPSSPQIKQRPSQVQNPGKFDNFARHESIPTPPKQYNQAPKVDAPKFIDGYRVQNSSLPAAKKPQSLHKIKFENYEKSPKTEMVPPKPNIEREEVQLLYVPIESLNRGQYNFGGPMASPQSYHSEPQGPLRALPKEPFTRDFPKQVPFKPLGSYNNQENIYKNNNAPLTYQDQIPKFSTVSSPFPTLPPTTPKPKKLKPHQPPLAIFLAQEARRGNQVKVGDVLSSLKHAQTIAVLDSVDPATAPKVFIGPSTLNPPEKYVKFELPYLSNIEHSNKKIRQLPFFVAPLSYNTPQGFAKIPFPSPHVGSVVINSQIKESVSTTSAPIDVIPNSYSTSSHYKQDRRPASPLPNVSYFSTTPPRTKTPENHQSNFYSIEPQTVSTIRPQKQQTSSVAPKSTKPGSYFLSDIDEYNPVNYQVQNNYKTPGQGSYNSRSESSTIQTTSTTVKASTHPSQLLETHNPYSINQAFHFSTPLDYHSYLDEGYATPGTNQPLSSQPSISSTTSTSPEPVKSTNREIYQSSPNYVQNYSPETQYQAELQNSRYNVNNASEYTSKPVSSYSYQSENQQNNGNTQPASNYNLPTEYNENIETQPPVNTYEENVNVPTSDRDVISTSSPYLYNQYEASYDNENSKTNEVTTTTTTTSTTTAPPTTRRTSIRNRGRPRYTTTQRTDSNESTRATTTRRPIRERRPSPNRPKYEPNKVSHEKSTRKTVDSVENTTKYTKTRTRGRVQYKPSENDEYYVKSNKQASKEEDLAYQRDVLHQNYPVTLMERSSTVNIEAITEPSMKISSNAAEVSNQYYDTDNAYSHDQASISQLVQSNVPRLDTLSYSSETEAQTETDAPKFTATKFSSFQSRSSLAPSDAQTPVEVTTSNIEEDVYVRPTTPIRKSESEEVSYATEPSAVPKQYSPNYSNTEISQQDEEETVTPKTTKEVVEAEEEENIITTTPTYNRVRIRPGVIRQHHPASTESKNKPEKKKSVQSITYRPTFERRGTTMRIEEIEADLKTKQIRSRPEVQEYRHPVYRPETTTEGSASLPTQDSATKRVTFRRRRPAYTTITTETSGSKTRSGSEVRSRFRSRRPTEKTETQTEISTTTTATTKNTYNRYSARPRLSERFNKKTEPEEVEDQDGNYSFNSPKYAEPDSEVWSTKFSADNFKPYNPNTIFDEEKTASVASSSDKNNDELDIITARNEYDNILISVTPSTNDKLDSKQTEVPPTLETLLQQSKVTKSDSGDTMSTLESMLEEVMKSLEDQDKNEFSKNVMKHEGGEIGEIPPESTVSQSDISSQKPTTVRLQETTTLDPSTEATKSEEEHKGRRRGYWKKIRVRPVTEIIETAESQFYSNTVNRLGQTIKNSKVGHSKSNNIEKKIAVTTYKPQNLEFLKDIFDSYDESHVEDFGAVELSKLSTIDTADENRNKKDTENNVVGDSLSAAANSGVEINTQSTLSDFETTTYSQDATFRDETYHSVSTEPPSLQPNSDDSEKSNGFNLMEYLFGFSENENESHEELENTGSQTTDRVNVTEKTNTLSSITEQEETNLTTEGTFLPDEITELSANDELHTENITEMDIRKISSESTKESNISQTTEQPVKVETSSFSSFMDPSKVLSTSMSTEISHETEICFRGKCIKTSKDIL